MTGNDTPELEFANGMEKNGLDIPLKDLSRSTSASSITARLAKLGNELVDESPVHRVNVHHGKPSDDPPVSLPQVLLSPSPRAFQRRFHGASRSTAQRIAALQERYALFAYLQINWSKRLL